MIVIKKREPRRAFTLIELLVVMGIILLIATLGYLTFPNISSRTMVDAANRVQGWLLAAKQMAKRDGRPTGVRLIVSNLPIDNILDTQQPPAKVFATKMQFVQQPDDFVGPMNGTAPSLCTCQQSPIVIFPPPGTQAMLLGSASVNDANGEPTGNFDLAPVQRGDYIVFGGSGTVYPIAGVQVAWSLNPPLGGNIPFLTLGTHIGDIPPPLPPAQPQTNYRQMNGPNVDPKGINQSVPYRIIRQPRRILGEEDLFLPGNTANQAKIDPVGATVIDTTQYIAGTTRSGCLNLPLPRTINGETCYEIMFSPSGAVVGPAAGNDMIGLWISNYGIPNPKFPPSLPQYNVAPARPVIVSIRTRTGLIGVFDVNSTAGNEYSFARDMRASGM